VICKWKADTVMFTDQEKTSDLTCDNCHTTCHHHQLYCLRCGWILPQAIADDPDAQEYATRSLVVNPPYQVDLQWGTSFFHHDAQLYISVMDNDTLFNVPIKASPIVIGRRGGSAIPHVDLMQYSAFELGVSRYHVRIDRVSNMLQVTDLESNNGTLLNNKRLEPKLPYVLPNLSVLQLGQMILRVHFA
jgi:hypothetical protein